MKRRDFIKLSGSVSAFGLLPFELKAMLKSADSLADCDFSNRKLVLINLAGGNDGLNTIIPLNVYDAYSALRPTIKVPLTGTNAAIRLDKSLPDNQQVALNPALKGFKALYDQGWMRIIQSVGYPSQNKSHFASTDLYLTGNDGNSWNNGTDSGWIGRFMELYYANELSNPYPLGVQIGSNKTSLGYHGEKEHGLAINITGQDPAGFYSLLNGLGGAAPTSIPNTQYGNELDYVIQTDQLSNKYSKAISDAFNTGSNQGVYPDTDIADQLKTVARLISGGLASKVYMVRLSGFDTHNGQIQGTGDPLGNHYKLLDQLSTAVQSFFNDLNGQSKADDVVGVTYSEFGRKAKENGNLGTDHGEIAPMFVFGKSVNSGVSGTNVDLSEATDKNNFQIKTVQFDYRQTFGTLMQNFLGANNTIIDAAFFNHTSNSSFATQKIQDLLKDSYKVPANCYDGTLGTAPFDVQHKTDAWTVYPNPFTDFIQLKNNDGATQIQYKIYSSSGRVIFNEVVVTPDSKITVDTSGLTTGIYFIQLSAGNGTETRKVIKL